MRQNEFPEEYSQKELYVLKQEIGYKMLMAAIIKEITLIKAALKYY